MQRSFLMVLPLVALLNGCAFHTSKVTASNDVHKTTAESNIRPWGSYTEAASEEAYANPPDPNHAPKPRGLRIPPNHFWATQGYYGSPYYSGYYR